MAGDVLSRFPDPVLQIGAVLVASAYGTFRARDRLADFGVYASFGRLTTDQASFAVRFAALLQLLYGGGLLVLRALQAGAAGLTGACPPASPRGTRNARPCP